MTTTEPPIASGPPPRDEELTAFRDRVSALARSAHGRGVEGAPALNPDEIDQQRDRMLAALFPLSRKNARATTPGDGRGRELDALHDLVGRAQHEVGHLDGSRWGVDTLSEVRRRLRALAAPTETEAGDEPEARCANCGRALGSACAPVHGGGMACSAGCSDAAGVQNVLRQRGHSLGYAPLPVVVQDALATTLPEPEGEAVEAPDVVDWQALADALAHEAVLWDTTAPGEFGSAWRSAMAAEVQQLVSVFARFVSPSAPGEGQGAAEGGDGAGLIAAERRRQVEQEGWTPDHDQQHTRGGPRWPSSLAHAATAYVHRNNAWWPWPNRPTFTSSPTAADRTRELAKAGALIAADLDLLNGTAPARLQAESGPWASICGEQWRTGDHVWTCTEPPGHTKGGCRDGKLPCGCEHDASRHTCADAAELNDDDPVTRAAGPREMDYDDGRADGDR